MAVIDNLISFWAMDEASGNATDSHGSNTLTETGGTIGSAAGKVGNARDFESADTEWFAITDNASMSTGDIDWSFACWVQIENLISFPVIAHKGWAGAPGANSEWVLYYNTTSSRLDFSKRSASDTATVTANNFGALSLATWYFIVIWHDASGNSMGICVNDGTPNTTASSTGLNDGTGSFEIGSSTSQGLYWDGLVDEVGFWKKKLSAAEITWLYNSGNGRSYADIVAEAGVGGTAIKDPLGGIIPFLR